MSDHDIWYADEDCIECGEPLADMRYPEDSEWIGDVGSGAWYEAVDHEVGHMCLGCRESWDSHANSLTVVLPDGTTAGARFDDGIMADKHPYGEQGVCLDELPDDVYAAVKAIVEGTGWVSTSAWRGYTKVPDEPAGFVTAQSGWHSTLTETDASDVINDILAGEYHSPRDHGLDVPVIGVFGTTSNVMSTGVDLYVPDGHADAITQLFEGASAGRDGSIRTAD
ncbi:hypothetical protein PN419_00455 [Halorubrum ezzemoulense]|uniref:hypothetical protein n=1 Tax=Halorubrum ezzemoulense TaxID=337243 RepID=UPI00232CCFF5|nr:hypothetical protein [Halorubrum ezzemoulense]MDB9247478.1 hypothetical protein [Halorubrum ezzemoulense]MDB9258613.1 hypothetical protein [Halorubrum ezzemoulense]MDB9264528.1 hypothetical protein [Halorubrum ezzemoulense]MDB9268974.1 hypothetical protein [Halorubrum ezzemoulense]MDB9271496.1 hypothetical protein [Halorubrum ezzemoulense]